MTKFLARGMLGALKARTGVCLAGGFNLDWRLLGKLCLTCLGKYIEGSVFP